MCGIAGVLSFHNGAFQVGSAYLEGMIESMVHRGPDGAGTWMSPDRRVGLGHRRLSIIDLSTAASQPMSNEDGSMWVVFNGEIYNHAEIREDLQRIGGHQWKTDHSDTEVILHAFEEWGIDCLHRFRGMFAIALWDGRRRELWLIRDRIGIKPLYYSVHHRRIAFASEIKALLQDPQQERAVNEEALYHLLSFLTTPAPQTLFQGICKLPGGTWLRVREDGSMQESRYWDVLDHTDPVRSSSENEIAERIVEELRMAVRLRKVSDVPVGVFLSGGIDSSVNTALFSEGESGKVKCFTIGYDGDYRSYQNELHYARHMAKLVDAEYHERILTQQDLLDFLPTMVRLQDEPIADPVCVPLYYVSKLARDNGVTVCQVGEGSDELFCGYPSWKLRLQLQHLGSLPVPRVFKGIGLFGLRLAGRQEKLEYEWLRRNFEQLPVFWGGAEAFTETHKKSLMSPRLRSRLAGLSSWEALKPIRGRFEDKGWEKSPLQWMTYLDLNLRLPELLLMRVDKMSMGVSLEARVPFLDHKFVELAMSIPESVKTRHGELKHILKKAVRGLIPNELIDRKKQGFGVPVYEWFLDRLGAFARTELNAFCKETDFLNRNAVMQLLEQRDGPRAWYLLNVALWWKQYICSETAAMETLA
ncbi:MAG: asparagine synthase (glutamine-hydrolyzing) [Chloroflexi bacterium]|nr:MAG: asparagine synthase (glutamine-hydrolyzing) [Chloroflexota bacterium]